MNGCGTQRETISGTAFRKSVTATTGALDEDNVSVTNGTRGSSPGFNRFHRSADNASSRRHLYEVALQHSAATS